MGTRNRFHASNARIPMFPDSCDCADVFPQSLDPGNPAAVRWDSRAFLYREGRMGYRHESEVLHKLPSEYLPPELALKFCADDQWVLQNGLPRLNMVEMWFDSRGRRDWIVTHKYPLRDLDGKFVGVIGILQNLDIREKRFAHLGRVGDIARKAGFSERQLQRNFHKVFGQTIQQFIIENRIHAAVAELTGSGLRISEIALKFGFNDQSAFSNCFKRVTGQTPRAYRVKVLGGK
jgi:AraC-like DNA-binding protein